MVDAGLDALLEKACATPVDRIRAGYVLTQLEKMTAAYADPAQRPAVEAEVAAWQAGSDELRKGISMAFLARARGMLGRAAGGAIHAIGEASGAHAAGRMFNRAAGKAGDIGAMAGEKLARSPLGAASMSRAKMAGGQEAQARMAQRLQPHAQAGRPAPRFEHEAQPGARLRPASVSGPAPWQPADINAFEGAMRAANTKRLAQTAPLPRGPSFLDTPGAPRNFGAEQSIRAGGTSSGIADPAVRTATMHAAALDGAFRAGAAHAANAHAGAVAAHGRVAARYAFKTGMKLAAVGGAVAAAGTAERMSSGGELSQAQHQERVNAGKQSHRGMGMAKAAPCWDGYKQLGMKRKGKKKVPNCVPEGGRSAGA